MYSNTHGNANADRNTMIPVSTRNTQAPGMRGALLTISNVHSLQQRVDTDDDQSVMNNLFLKSKS
jgi:hypothetical protein